MEKKDVQRILREKMKKIGFESKGNYHYKKVEEDYMVGVWLEHHPYCNGYFVEYGALFLPDERKMPFRGFCDWSMRFEFTKKAEDNLKNYPLENIFYSDKGLIDYFEYDKKEKEELSIALDLNIEKKLINVFNKKYVLDYYRKEIDMLVTLLPETAKKILAYGEFDMNEVERIKKENGIQW